MSNILPPDQVPVGWSGADEQGVKADQVEYDNTRHEEAIRQITSPDAEVTYPLPTKNPEVQSQSSGFFFYSCAHGASNEPCPEHHPGQPVMPQDWMKTYQPATPDQPEVLPGGIHDSASVG